jgi:DNA-binding CsgD family transcriptional regulator
MVAWVRFLLPRATSGVRLIPAGRPHVVEGMAEHHDGVESPPLEKCRDRWTPAPASARLFGVVTRYGLFGRNAEFAVLAEAVRDVLDGHAGALWIEGEAGIGKTRLVECLVELATDHAFTVFGGAAHPFERTRPFGVVAHALGLSPRSADPRKAAIGRELTGRGADRENGASGDAQYRIVESIVELVDTACAAGPVLVVADDIHWADSASLLALSSLARQLPLAALLVVVTMRTSPMSGEVVRVLADLAATGARSVHLQPLDRESLVELATQELGAPPGPTLAALLDKAGGNPLWTMALLRSFAGDGLLRAEDDVVEATTTELPRSMSDLVVRRLGDLPPATLDLLHTTAVLGDTVSLRDVVIVARRSPGEVVGDLAAAFDAQLLDEDGDRVVFRHQLVHEAIYRHTPAPSRRLLHRDAATALTARGASLLEVADHLLLGSERGDEQAVAMLRQAAQDAAARSPRAAVELVRRAEALLPGGHPDADSVSAEVVGALLRAGDVAEASARAEAVLTRRHAPEVDLPLRLSLLSALALQNRAEEVIAAADAGLVGSPDLGPFEVPLLAQQSWAFTYSGDISAGEMVARRSVAIADDLGVPALTVWALTALLIAVGRQGRFAEALALARRAAELAESSPDVASFPLQPKLFVGLTLFECDRVDEARVAYRAALEDEFGSAWWLSETLMADAQACFAVGEWDDAVPRLVASGDAAREKDHPLLESQSLAHRAIIATATGDLGTARDLLGQIDGPDEGEGLGYNAGVVASAKAALGLADGDDEGAFDTLLGCWRFLDGRGDRFYDRCIAPDLVRLALALDRRDVAVGVAAVVEAGVALAPEVPTVHSVALRCRGMVDNDAEPLIEAVAIARETSLLVEHTGACEDAARLLASVGRSDEAVAMLDEALGRYEGAGAEAWARRVRADMRALGARPGRRGLRSRPTTGWGSLTDTERAVSQLVAEGLTNAAVARRLYMSPHTVNTHLRHIFAKLGVPNRVALAALVDHSIE